MALVVYDQGYPIKTPVSALFKPRGVDKLTESGHPEGLPGSDDIARDEAHELEHAFLNAESARQRPPRQLPAAPEEQESPTTYQPGKPFAGAERRKHGLTARQLLVSPVYITTLQSTLRSAASQMREHGIHHLVVTDADRRPLGLLSTPDLIPYGDESLQPVADACQRQIVVAALETELSLLAHTFVTYPVRAIPVVDPDGQLAGIITRTDLLRLLINNARVESWA